MGRLVNIVVTCTNRKTRPVGAQLRLGSVQATGVERRAETWIERLESSPAKPIPARDLYSGDHWHVARSLPEEASKVGLDARLWVCSAGYGLVPLAAALRPYSATFTAENPDSVQGAARGPAAVIAARRWWGRMAEWQGPESGAPRSIAELAERHPGSPLLIVASPKYAGPIAEDLAAARECLRQTEHLAVFSGGTVQLDGLGDHLIPCDARLQGVVGGARFSLNARAARKAIAEEWPLRANELRGRFKQLLGRQPLPRKYERRTMTDAQVRQFIKRALKQDPGVSRTPLLRKLRTDDLACEQSRFANLYQQVRREVAGA